MTIERACREMAAVRAAYADREASPEEAARVEAHLAQCETCRTELRRSQAGVAALDRCVRALMTAGEQAARDVRPYGVLTRPDRLHEAVATRSSRVGGLATLLAVGVLALIGVLFLARGMDQPGRIETARPPLSSPPASLAPGPPAMVASVDGLVDPAVVTYVRRVAAQADAQQAGGLVLEVSASTGLASSMADLKNVLSSSPLPTRVVDADADTPQVVDELAQAATQTAPDNVATQHVPMTLWEALWHRLLDPTTAYVLLVLGLFALSLELAQPGSLAPGAVGVACLGLASLPLITLPTNWLAVALLVAGVALMALEGHFGGHGVFVLGGGLLLLVGSAFLFTPLTTLEPWLAPISIAPATLFLGAAFGVSVGSLFARLAHRTAALPSIAPVERLVGAHGETRSHLNPDGVVQVNGQLWSAHALGGPLAAGETVRVVARHGLILDVESAVYRPAATQKGALR